MQVVQDYLSMGVPTVWVLDPVEKKAYVAEGGGGLREVMDQVTAAEGRLVIRLEEIFG